MPAVGLPEHPLTSRTESLAPEAARRVDAMLARYRPRVIVGIREALDGAAVRHAQLMRQHLGIEDGGAPTSGKLLRPSLCLLSCEALRGDPARALPAAVAIELTHNFTLIHDDIEDNSSTRHGRPTLWTRAGIPQAINAGDGMFVLAERTLLRMADAGVPPERVLEASRVLNDACVRLCEGQYADIGFEARTEVSLAEYEAMIAGKTGALLGASAAIGAIAAGVDAPTVDALAECGRLLGLAFQVQDDVLGIWGEAAVTGKPVADDIRSRKKSFPIVYSMEHLPRDRRVALLRIYASPQFSDADVDAVLALLDDAGARAASTAAAERWATEAIDALTPIDLNPDRRPDLEALASFFVHRAA